MPPCSHTPSRTAENALALICLLAVTTTACGTVDTDGSDNMLLDASGLDVSASDAGTPSVDGATADVSADATPLSDVVAADSATSEKSCHGAGDCQKHGDEDACEGDGCNWTTCKPTTPPEERCDGVDNDCDGFTDSFNMGVGSVVPKPLCSDGDTCNGSEKCSKGKCVTGAPMVCKSKQCAEVSCDKLKGCQYTPQATANCSDGDSCTTEDTCLNGVCKGKIKACDDGDSCISETCNPETGSCQKKSKVCTDGNPCTKDSCDKTIGCKSVPIPGCTACKSSSQCDDKKKCTKDVCQFGQCKHSQIKGCVGPTDFRIISLYPSSSPVVAPGPAVFSVTLENLGKSNSTIGGGVYLNLSLSEDNVYSASKDLIISKGKWPGYNVGISSFSQKTKDKVSIKSNIKSASKLSAMKYLCGLVVIVGGDADKSDNSKCVPITLKL